MSRELKRVSMDFDWPLNKVWYGYQNSLCNGECDDCKHYARLKGLKYRKYGCPDFDTDPPVGNGYQLWENTSEGSPISPVFATLKELAEWCEDGATVLGFLKISKEEWLNSFYWQIIEGERVKMELNITKKQVELIQDALQGYLNVASDFLTNDELAELNILASDFLAQIPDKLYEEG